MASYSSHQALHPESQGAWCLVPMCSRCSPHWQASCIAALCTHIFLAALWLGNGGFAYRLVRGLCKSWKHNKAASVAISRIPRPQSLGAAQPLSVWRGIAGRGQEQTVNALAQARSPLVQVVLLRVQCRNLVFIHFT